MKKNIDRKLIFKFFAIIFGLNFLWEISQMFLYEIHSVGFLNFVFVHVKASLGDVVIFGVMYLLGLVLFRNKTWFLEKRFSVFIFAMGSGLFIATLIEKYAIATDRWQYNELMPIIPVLNVGLSPILQLIILPPLTIILAQKINAKK